MASQLQHTGLRNYAADGFRLRLSALAGGLLLGFSYPPYGLSALAWFAFVPLLLSIRRLNARDSFLNAWIFYLACFTVAFSWPLFHIRNDTAFVSGLAWLAFTLCLAVPFGLAGMRPIRDRGTHRIWLAGGLVLLLELLLRLGSLTMPWTMIAHTQLTFDGYVRGASVTGAEGLSMAVLAVNLLIASYLDRRRWRSLVPALSAVCILVLLSVLGSTRRAPVSGPILRLATVQPNIDPLNWSDVHDSSRVALLITLSENALDTFSVSPDVLIWPETSLPVADLSKEPPAFFSSIRSLARSRNVAVLTGAITVQSTTDSQVEYSNSALLFLPDGSIRQESKNRLVPFAEYVPLSRYFSGLRIFAVPAGGVSGYVPGTRPAAFTFRDATLGVMICFESAFPEYAGELTAAGSNLFVVLTQDGWWSGHHAPVQHLQVGRLRAAEQGRWIVQASVSGLSGLIAADGSLIHRSALDKREAAVFEVPLHEHRTFYQRYGRLAVRTLLGIWILSFGLYGLILHRNTR